MQAGMERNLRERFRDGIHRECSRLGPAGVVRVEVPVPRIDALAWLRAQDPRAVKTYWADRDGGGEAAGVGAADLAACAGPDGVHALFEGLRRRLDSGDAGARYFGGMRFDRGRACTPAWRAFGGCRFVLPRFELRQRDGESVLACQWLRSETDEDSLLQEVDTLAFRPAASGGVRAAAGERRDLPDRNGWEAAVTGTLALLSEGPLEKLVLARRSTFGFTRELDPLACLEALSPGAARCYRFCFIPAYGSAFLGVSPERLYRRDGRQVRCEAIAGTRVRGDGVSLDRQLERDLMASEKERREQDYVARGVREGMARLCRSLSADPGPSVVKLRQCQHLMTAFQGVLRDGVGDADLVDALHPTPAVGGYPTDLAVRRIDETEPFDRGWYAGPVGWVGRDRAELAVAIRSGLVEGSTLSVFAGAGIVAGSAPGDEWRELDYKIGHFTRALNLPQ